ncbi:MAG: hypothetical protein ACYS0E_03495 [Planctomycetota bacterium]|jgi:uncharacterized membrane protein YeaQ/YmgE (transglycosylase-associated protein family)
MGIVLFLVVGGLIGWAASLIIGCAGQQDIVGCALGGWLAPKLGIF